MCKIAHFELFLLIQVRPLHAVGDFVVQRSVNMRVKMRFTSSLSRVA
jgi:hypothetical protein